MKYQITLSCGCKYLLPQPPKPTDFTLCGDHAETQTVVSQDEVESYKPVYDFTWVNKISVRPADIEDWTAAAVKIVAWTGQAEDWAAYLGPSDWDDQKVAEQGDKIPQAAAELLFPTLKWSGRYYRH